MKPVYLQKPLYKQSKAIVSKKSVYSDKKPKKHPNKTISSPNAAEIQLKATPNKQVFQSSSRFSKRQDNNFEFAFQTSQN
ncbi:hypothetical protein [Kordia sp.]|uniref:hypothetical protein n=1 Tax=Kordia sp. TaxID=1965332 RepID=UPI003D28833B